MAKEILLIVSLFTLASVCPVCHAEPLNDYILLDGVHKFSSVDDFACSTLSYDDSRLRPIKVPGSWQSQGINPVKGIGWYRMHFFVPEGFNRIQPAILLGRIGDADEVFLNGVRIGGEGLIRERFVEATKVERLYRIPSRILRYGADNILAVRVMNTYLNGGIFDGNNMIADYNHLLIEKYYREKYVLTVEFCLFTLFALFFLASLFLYIKGTKNKEYIYFWLFTSLYSILFFLGSVTFYNAGLKVSFIQQTINVLSALLPACLILLLFHMYQLKINLYLKAILLFYVIISLTFLLFPGYAARVFLLTVWKILFIFSALYLVFLSVQVYLRKFSESGPILIGFTGLVVGMILESIGGLDLLQITGFFLWDYSTIFFMMCIMYALMSRYARIQEELRSASVKIFDAHEDERRRLARELHDGVGQSLLSIKLQLKMLDAKAGENMAVDKEAFTKLIAETAGVIDELRAVAMDLRPSFLENVGLDDAIVWHARRVQEKIGMPINIQAEGLMEIDPKIKDNIYRIFQEALNNVIQHAEAGRVEVILEMKEKILLLQINDNGKGFDPVREADGKKGIGLYTIRERVGLLGGILSIKSSEKSGTRMSIEVPVE